jgi:hypothetical protein
VSDKPSGAAATQPAKVTPFAGVTELMSEKAPQATFSNERAWQ